MFQWLSIEPIALLGARGLITASLTIRVFSTVDRTSWAQLLGDSSHSNIYTLLIWYATRDRSTNGITKPKFWRQVISRETAEKAVCWSWHLWDAAILAWHLRLNCHTIERVDRTAEPEVACTVSHPYKQDASL